MSLTIFFVNKVVIAYKRKKQHVVIFCDGIRMTNLVVQ
jgi:hypothetical protein